MANPRLANQMMIDNDSLDINFCETLLGVNCDLQDGGEEDLTLFAGPPLLTQLPQLLLPALRHPLLGVYRYVDILDISR